MKRHKTNSQNARWLMSWRKYEKSLAPQHIANRPLFPDSLHRKSFQKPVSAKKVVVLDSIRYCHIQLLSEQPVFPYFAIKLFGCQTKKLFPIKSSCPWKNIALCGQIHPLLTNIIVFSQTRDTTFCTLQTPFQIIPYERSHCPWKTTQLKITPAWLPAFMSARSLFCPLVTRRVLPACPPALLLAC